MSERGNGDDIEFQQGPSLEQDVGEEEANRIRQKQLDQLGGVSQGKSGTDHFRTVENRVRDDFGAASWKATEAALATHMTLLLKDTEPRCLVLTAPSGTGKSTVLDLLACHSTVYRSDEFTPASFVSHDASLSESELEDVDLLKKVRHQTLMSKDMANWFSGDRSRIRDRMSTLVRVLDGDGYSRDTGAHGRRGYTGDFRFNILGATVPLDHRVWDVMGHTGNRIVLHQIPDTTTQDDVVQKLREGTSYEAEKQRCSDAVHDLLDQRWEQFGGYGSVEKTQPPEEALSSIATLSDIVKHARTPSEDDQPEGVWRIAQTLVDLAHGRALLEGRTEVQMTDIQVPARVTLSTMPKKRRRYVQILLDPETNDALTASDFESHGVSESKPTILDRMELLEGIGLGTIEEEDGRGTKKLELDDDLAWPPEIEFPRFT